MIDGKHSLAEIIAALSAVSVIVAVSRALGYFLVIDIKLMSLINMSDIISSAFYTIPFTAIAPAASFLFFNLREGFKAPPSYSSLEDGLDEAGRRALSRAFWRLNNFLLIGCGLAFLLSISAFFYYGAVFFIAISVMFPTFLYLGWVLIYTGRYRYGIYYVYGGGVVMASFAFGLQDGQAALGDVEENYQVVIEGVEFPAFVSRLTQEHVFYTDGAGVFHVVPLSEVTRMTLIESNLDWFR